MAFITGVNVDLRSAYVFTYSPNPQSIGPLITANDGRFLRFHFHGNEWKKISQFQLLIMELILITSIFLSAIEKDGDLWSIHLAQMQPILMSEPQLPPRVCSSDNSFFYA